jgi:cell division protein FtsI/penicillin-binding protein 2
MGIILNPQTGEIVSMVSVPHFNPNNPKDFEVEYLEAIYSSDILLQNLCLIPQ